MPVIAFPNLDVVRSAIAEGAVPPSVYRANARVGFDADGRVWVQPSVTLSRASVSALGRRGAVADKDNGAILTAEVSSWLELIPLVPAAVTPEDRPSTVLFDLPDAAGLPILVSELHRLGAGKISYRWLDNVSPRGERSEISTHAQILVESPPFHSLLRSDRPAFVQQTSRVWVEAGWRHPLTELIDLPEGQMLLIRAPRTWETLADGPFQFGPDTFLLSDRLTAGDDHSDLKISVSVRLIPTTRSDPPELWVLRDQAVDRLRLLVEQTDDRLLARLSVAVGTSDGRQVAVLRARPNRDGPPVLVLDGLACRPYLRLPNLYIPVDHRLRPPLRRDAVRRIFAADANVVVWLEPAESGSFTIRGVPDSAFRPLEDLIEYAADRGPQLVSPTTGENPFALSPFIVRDGAAPPPRRRPSENTSTMAATILTLAEIPQSNAANAGLLSRIVRWFAPKGGDNSESRSEPKSNVDEPPRSLDAREDRRAELEGRLLSALDHPDGPNRSSLWSELARQYAAAHRWSDAALAWLNALWERDDPPAQWSRAWLQAETAANHGGGSDDAVREWLTKPSTPVVVRSIAAAVSQSSPSKVLVGSLGRIQQLLDEHEDWLPVRAAWLARVGLTRLTGGDRVGLARTRDRLLERLHDRGLSADLDVPTAIRFAGQGAGPRAEAVRGWLTQARPSIQGWLDKGASAAAVPTGAYADLILAWGVARLGEREVARALLSGARAILGPLDAAHSFLLDAFTVRIEQALEGRTAGPLPADLLGRLVELRDRERIDRGAREKLLLVKTQHFLRHSRILAPTELVDAFNEGWLDPHVADGPNRDLADLRYVADRDELANRLLSAVATAGRDMDRLPSLLTRALDLAPRLGETVAIGILGRLLAALDSWSFAGTPERVEMEVSAVERGLFVAAHFDRTPAVQRLLASLDRLLEARRGGDPGDSRPAEDALIAVIGQGLRGLRRLGLRAEADRLLTRLAEWIAPGGDMAAERRRRPQAWPLTVRRMLTLAGGWFYVGRDAPAMEIVDEARRLLFSPQSAAGQQLRLQTELAVSYLAALAQAPVRLALNGVEEVFARLPGLTDNMVTNTHFALSKLRMVEAAVRAIVTDDFALAPAVRRWLDDDEYRVRRRIHRDTRILIGSEE